MNSKNKPRPLVAEAHHIAKLKELPCVICGASEVEIHEPKQGLWYAAMPLCIVCHRDPVYGWHGQRRNWAARKMDELDAISATVQLLMEQT